MSSSSITRLIFVFRVFIAQIIFQNQLLFLKSVMFSFPVIFLLHTGAETSLARLVFSCFPRGCSSSLGPVESRAGGGVVMWPLEPRRSDLRDYKEHGDLSFRTSPGQLAFGGSARVRAMFDARLATEFFSPKTANSIHTRAREWRRKGGIVLLSPRAGKWKK